MESKAFTCFYERCGNGWRAVVDIGQRRIVACAATQGEALEAALAVNSRRKPLRPITTDPNKLRDLPQYDNNPIWNEIEARE